VPNASSQITKEFQEHKDMQEWFSAPDKVVKNFDAFKDFTGSVELKQIKILGGEPTMDPLVLDFLETIIDSYETLPALRFTTNGTNLNKRFRNIMEKFEDIHIVFSIDAVGDAYEYIRTNANWSKTKKIIEEIFAKDMAKIYGFNIVLMPYNMFHLTDLLDWFRTLSDKGYDFETFYDLSEGYTTEMQGVLPEHLDFLKQTLTEYSDMHQYDIDDIMDLLNSVTFKQKSFDNFVKYNNRLDEIRKTSLENLDSRFKQYVG
jgi:molybdenum cofactor biosynthesis enzyme MoaA